MASPGTGSGINSGKSQEELSLFQTMKKFGLNPDSKAWFCWDIQKNNSSGIVDKLSNGYKYVESYFQSESEEKVFNALSQAKFFTSSDACIKILEKSCCPDVFQFRVIHQNEDAEDITKDWYPSVKDKIKRGECVDTDLVEKMEGFGVNPDWIAHFSHGSALTYSKEDTLITGWKDIIANFKEYSISESEMLQSLGEKGYIKCELARIFVSEYRNCPPPPFSIASIVIDEIKEEIESFSDDKPPYLLTIKKIEEAGLDPFSLVKIRHNLWGNDSYLTINTLLSAYDLIYCEMIKSGLSSFDEKDFFHKIYYNQSFIYKGFCVESLFIEDEESEAFLEMCGLILTDPDPDNLDPDDINPGYIDEFWKRLLTRLSPITEFLLNQQAKLVWWSKNYILIAVISSDLTRIVQSKTEEIKEALSEMLNRPFNVIILGAEKSNIRSIKKLLRDKFDTVKPIPNPLRWQNLHFLSEQEVRVAKALDAQGVLFFPNASCRINSGEYRKNLIPDFLVVIDGYLGILECDSRIAHPSAANDHERDRLFQKHGIRFIQRYSYQRCLNEKNVVDEFIKMMVAHFRIRL